MAGAYAGPSEFTVPGFALRSGFAGAVLYYVLVLNWHWLSAEEGRGLIVLLYVIHGVISDLAGKHFRNKGYLNMICKPAYAFS